MKNRNLLGLASGVLLIAAINGCDSSSSTQADGDVTDLTNTGTFSNPAPTSAPLNTQTVQAIRQIRPGLAVRGMSCLACHANIQASVITDFGNGDSWYLDQNLNATPSGLFGNGYYNPYTWQTMAHLQGEMIVPVEDVPASVVVNSTPSGTPAPVGTVALGDYLMASNRSYLAADFINWDAYWNPANVVPATLPLTASISPVTTPTALPAVVPANYIYIGAPTAAQILAGAPAPQPAGNSWVESSTGNTSISGLIPATGASGRPYTTNSGLVECAGQDVVVKGTLLLSSAQIAAGNGGCRLYVTGPVFIEGALTYANPGDATSNLQITSATAIVMGVGLSGNVYNSGFSEHNGGVYSSNPLDARFNADARSAIIRQATTPASYVSWAQTAIVAEAENIGSANLPDASVTAGAAATAVSGAGQTRVAIDFNHLLLNAPVVHSRYLGSFTGVIIAELAVFSLGEFVFNYDTVFDNSAVTILPNLPTDILCVADSQLGCNATSPAPSPTPTPTSTSPACTDFLSCGGGALGI